MHVTRRAPHDKSCSAKTMIDTADIAVTPLGASLGAEIAGLDLTSPLSGESVRAIEAAMLEYKVVVFRGQPLSAVELAALGAHFGELQAHVQKRYQHEEVAEVVWMTNRKPDGSFDEVGAARGSATNTRDGWHSDMAFDPVPAKFTILHALDVPSHGGRTCFADTEMVYRLLAPEQQRRLVGLRAEFAYGGRATNDRNRLAAEALSEADKAASIAVHPVVSAHPETGVPAVFASPYTTSRVLDLAEAEAGILLNEIYDLMDSQAVRWEHQWLVGDTIMWENRSGLMHSGRLDYPRNEARTFLRTTVRGAPIAAYVPQKT